MLKRLIAANLVTTPAIWGKLPAHADFVSSGMRNGDLECWKSWLTAQTFDGKSGHGSSSASLPAAFVIPASTLGLARRGFVVGAMARSMDRLGRPHPLVVYQFAQARWLLRHFSPHASCPQDWFFWLARTVSRHASLHEAADIRTLERATGELWRLHAPSASQLLTDALRGTTDPLALSARSRALLDRLMGEASQDDPALRLAGVHFMPWVDWPERIALDGGKMSSRASDTKGRRFEGAFWQQDASGGFVNAAVRADALWSGWS